MPENFYSQANMRGDENVGFYGFATDSYCLAGNAMQNKRALENTLRVPVLETHVMGLDLIKLFIIGNSSFVFISDFVFERDRQRLENVMENKTEVIELRTEKALGNMMLINDNGIVISPMIKYLQKYIERASGLPVGISFVAGISTIGAAGFATNRGCLLHPAVKEREVKVIEKILGVNAEIGTVSFGSQYPGAGIIGNRHGFITSNSTSGPELGRIAEALGFVG